MEVGTETTSEQHLDKYIILHCAKLELSLIDAASGTYMGNKLSTFNNKDLMHTILR